MIQIDMPGKPKLYQPYDLPGWEVIGTVKTDHSGTGALGRNAATGEYAQINAGTVKRLDRRAVQRIIGGLGRPQNPPRTDFERRLRELMDAARIPSYAALARESKISTQTIDNACRGDYTPSLETMVKLAGALGCKVDDLL